MNISFFNGTVGANTQQSKLDILANNVSNVQTDGFKSQNAGFLDLLYNNMDAAPPADGDLTVGSGTRVEKTDINFAEGPLMETGMAFDYAIIGEGYFALYDPGKDEIRYTRDGNFFMSQFGEGNGFYLCAEDGSLVLDKDSRFVLVESRDDDPELGVFDFANKEGILLQGKSQFIPAAKNGEAVLKEDATLKRHFLEGSNVDLADQMARVIEAQRAFQLNLRMVSTADEIEQTVNGLRQ